MIVQESGGKLMLFRQTDHALLSGAFATAWGSGEVPGPPRREQTLIAAARHDDGWAEWELAPKLHASGDPVDFIRVPVSDHAPLYRRGIDLVEAEDPFAGLVVSLHGERLYTRPFHPGMDPRIEHLKGADLDIAKEHVEHEHQRQKRLKETLDDDAGVDAEEAWRLLQVWDRLSLLVCMQPIKAGTEQTMPPILIGGEDVRIRAAGSDEGLLELNPYPFADDPAEFAIGYVHTALTKWSDEAAFRADYRAAPHATLRVCCRPA